MESAPQAPGKPQDPRLGEPLVQTACLVSRQSRLLKRVSVAQETFSYEEFCNFLCNFSLLEFYTIGNITVGEGKKKTDAFLAALKWQKQDFFFS